ncbi:MAG: OmpA family protein [Muribaculaceae bacterium]|nr:OmpA family protein [Muribaculaceae bacterium]
MKKLTLIAFACALFVGAQSLAAEETTYVSDPSQGVLLNRMKDNWFITAEGGASVYASDYASRRELGDRFMPAGSIYVGKWFSPVFGGRIGVNALGLKGLATGPNYLSADHGRFGNYYKTKYVELGPVFDVMVNLTNWWCGYRPGRVYNASLYVGAGAYFTMIHKWEFASNEIMTLRAGLINSFNVSKQVAIALDLRYSALDGLQNWGGAGWNHKYGSIQAYLGVTYNFRQRDWNAPVVPVCPEPENCDALRARLSAADARIADLEEQLKACLNRPVETVVEKEDGPLATVYYPIGVSRLNAENQRVVKAIASVMAQDQSKKYVVTGWADNLTGGEAINNRLRQNRAEGVKSLLVKNGVAESQLTVTTNNNDRYPDLGMDGVALGRAVTIEEAK